MGVNIKRTNQISATQIQECIEIMVCPEQVRFVPGCKTGSTFKNKPLSSTTSKKQRRKLM